MANVGKNGNEEVLTKQKLLCYAGEFDIESVHFLKLAGMNLKDVMPLGGCKNLSRLDLSNNLITTVKPLADLKMIISLNISNNRITNIDCFMGMERLEELLAAGNLLSNTERISCLKGLASLKKLRLKDDINKLTNPLCAMKDYHSSVLRLLPMLVVFDGNRVQGKGSELYKLCCDLDQQIQTGRTFGPVPEIPLAEPWIKPGYLEINPPAMNDSKAAKEFESVLKECKKLSDGVGAKLV